MKKEIVIALILIFVLAFSASADAYTPDKIGMKNKNMNHYLNKLHSNSLTSNNFFRESAMKISSEDFQLNKQDFFNKAEYSGYIIQFKGLPVIERLEKLKKEQMIRAAGRDSVESIESGDSIKSAESKEGLERQVSISSSESEIADYETDLRVEHENAIADIRYQIEKEELASLNPISRFFDFLKRFFLLVNKNGVIGKIYRFLEYKKTGITGHAIYDSELKINGEFYKVFNGISMNISDEDAEIIKQSRYVKAVYPNYLVNYSLMSSVPLMKADKIWELDSEGNMCSESGKECLTGTNITIAIIDTGVDYNHPAFGANASVALTGFEKITSRKLNLTFSYPTFPKQIFTLDNNRMLYMSDCKLNVYDFSSKETSVFDSFENTCPLSGIIKGDYIAYSSYFVKEGKPFFGESGIYLLNTNNGETIRVKNTSNSLYQTAIGLSDKYLAFLSAEYDNRDYLYAYNINNREKYLVANLTIGINDGSYVDGDTIVSFNWTNDWLNYTFSIYNLTSGEQRHFIPEHSGPIMDVNNGKIIYNARYMDIKLNNFVVYDIATGEYSYYSNENLENEERIYEGKYSNSIYWYMRSHVEEDYVYYSSVVWGSLGEIYVYDKANEKTILLNSGKGAGDFDSYGNRLCFISNDLNIYCTEYSDEIDYTPVFERFNSSRFMGGYNFYFFENYNPMDDNGHGTHVAGIAAGNGTLKGVAPNAKLYAYKVLSSEGGGGTEGMIIRAIEKSTDPNNDGDFSDHHDVISLSLSLDCKGYFEEFNEHCGPDDFMSQAIDNAVDAGVVAVIAAGNSGQLGSESIGSPGTARKAITVGASYNNDSVGTDSEFIITSDSNKKIESSPLSIVTNKTINATLVYAGHGYKEDLNRTDLNVSGKIVLLRSDTDYPNRDWWLYNYDKIKNSQNAGAVGVVIYNVKNNNLSKDYLDFVNIPAVSIGKDDGEYLIGLINSGNVEINLTVINNPYKVIFFSSKGPVKWNSNEEQKTLIKPDIIAPGVSICSAQYDSAWNYSAKLCPKGYTSISGTSMATPHVTGAVALIKQARPEWTAEEIKMALKNTAIDIGEEITSQGYGFINIQGVLNLRGKPAISHVEVDGQKNSARTINITGTASGRDFASYKLYYGDETLENWIELKSSNERIEEGLLHTLDISSFKNGDYSLKLSVFNNEGEESKDINYFQVKRYKVDSLDNSFYKTGDEIKINGEVILNDRESYKIEHKIENEPEWLSEGIRLSDAGDRSKGILGYWNTSLIEKANSYDLKITFYQSGEENEVQIYNIYIDPDFKAGPIYFNHTFNGFDYDFLFSPTIADIDNDKKNEIILSGLELWYGYEGIIQAYRSDGSEYDENWPIISQDCFWDTPSTGDIDGDGKEEIVMFAFDCESGKEKPSVFNEKGEYEKGWPKNFFSDTLPVGIILSDLNKDNKMEIIYYSRNYSYDESYAYFDNYGVSIHAWDGEGNELNGWPFSYLNNLQGGNVFQYNKIAVGDVNGDGYNELVVPMSSLVNNSANSSVLIVDWKGNLISKWNVPESVVLYNVMIGDLDNNGISEIIISSASAAPEVRLFYPDAKYKSRVYAYNSKGETLNGWPVELDSYYPTLGSFIKLNDNCLGVVVGERDSWNNKNSIYVYDCNGKLLDGWPREFGQTLRNSLEPVVADIDADGEEEIIVLSSYEDNKKLKMMVLDKNNSELKNHSRLVMRDERFVYETHSPVITRLNEKNTNDVIIFPITHNYRKNFNLYSFKNNAESKMSWPMVSHDAQHTSDYSSYEKRGCVVNCEEKSNGGGSGGGGGGNIVENKSRNISSGNVIEREINLSESNDTGINATETPLEKNKINILINIFLYSLIIIFVIILTVFVFLMRKFFVRKKVMR